MKILFSEIAHIEFYVPEARMSITSARNKHLWAGRKCDAICNGTLFNMAANKNSTITYGAVTGKQVGYLFCKYGLVFNNNSVKYGPLEEAKTSGGDFIGAAPLIVRDGKMVQEWGNRKASTQITGKHIRTAIGITNDSLVMYTSNNELALNNLAAVMIKQGCRYALNLDGGGSTSMIVDGKYIRNTSRLLGNFVMVWKKQQSIEAKKEDDELIEKKIINVYGKDIELDTITKDGRTFIEMRKQAELTGNVVNYDSKTHKISIMRKEG